jgi:hypothetical protein
MTVLNVWTWIVLVVSAIVLATVVRADTPQRDVLTCFEGIGSETEWNQCLDIMFAPCSGLEVGSDGHVECLSGEREEWRQAKIAAETEVLERLTDEGMTELSGLMVAWPKFVEDKCTAVAEARAAISFEAAALGCQISELALMTNEMTACLAGRSTEDYCQLRTE